jgi:hypothetical protein
MRALVKYLKKLGSAPTADARLAHVRDVRKIAKEVVSAKDKHKKALSNIDDNAKFFDSIPDPDPTSIAGDTIEVPSALLKFLQKTKTKKTKTLNKFYKESKGLDPELFDDIERKNPLSFW